MAESLNQVLVVRATHTAATAVDETYTMARAGIVMDFIVIATENVAGGVTLESPAATAICGPLDPGTTANERLFRPITGDPMVTASKVLAVGDVLAFSPGADIGQWEAYAYIYPTPAVAE